MALKRPGVNPSMPAWGGEHASFSPVSVGLSGHHIHGERTLTRALALGLRGSELACALYPSEPHVPLRGAVADSCDSGEDPGAPTGQGLGTAAVTGNSKPDQGQAVSRGGNQRA